MGSEVYQKAMDDLFEGLPCFIIVDDILICGKDEKEHDANLKMVLERCQQIGLKLNKNKCKFRMKEVCYVGHHFTDKGILPDPDKVRAIVDMPKPTDVTSLQRLFRNGQLFEQIYQRT